nr:MAG TPA_asm: hypothetical protein [Caudoviricetes sp.]
MVKSGLVYFCVTNSVSNIRDPFFPLKDKTGHAVRVRRTPSAIRRMFAL